MFLHVQGWKLEHTKYVINLSCFSLFFICFSPGLYLSNVSNILKGPNWYDNFRCWTYERKDKKKVNPFRSSLHYKIWQSYRRDIYATFTQHLRNIYATFTRHLHVGHIFLNDARSFWLFWGDYCSSESFFFSEDSWFVSPFSFYDR